MSGSISLLSELITNFVNILRNYIEYVVMLFGLLFFYFLLQIGFYSTALPAFGIVVGAAFSLIARQFEKSSIGHESQLAGLNCRIPVIVTSMYVSSVFFVYRFYTYELPTIHYIIFAVYVGFVVFEISQKEPPERVLPQLLVLCFFTYWSRQLAFPAGAFQPDTMGEYVPLINQSLSGSISSFDLIYQSLGALNLSFIKVFILISELSTFTAYALLATLILSGTVLIISLLSQALPSIEPQIVLFAGLIFALSSWMLGRGMRPNKLNFFYPLILLLGISIIFLFDTNNRSADNRWGVIALLTGSVLIFGHRYSAGAGLFMLTTTVLFVFLRRYVFTEQYSQLNRIKGVGMVGAYTLAIMGNPLHQEPLLGRLSSTITSVIGASSASSGGPGRYSSLQLDVLVFSTAPQMILFALVIFGFCWTIKRKQWEYDYVTVWLILISSFLVFALVQNSVDTSPQRFYSLLILFGFNVFAAVALYHRFNLVSPHLRTSAVILVVVSFSLLSLASPIASPTTGPVGDEVPHGSRYTTDQIESGSEWTEQYSFNTIDNIPIEQTEGTAGQINTTQFENDTYYIYSERKLIQSGGVASGGNSLGGRVLVFVTPPSRSTESVIYSNGDKYALQHQRSVTH